MNVYEMFELYIDCIKILMQYKDIDWKIDSNMVIPRVINLKENGESEDEIYQFELMDGIVDSFYTYDIDDEFYSNDSSVESENFVDNIDFSMKQMKIKTSELIRLIYEIGCRNLKEMHIFTDWEEFVEIYDSCEDEKLKMKIAGLMCTVAVCTGEQLALVDHYPELKHEVKEMDDFADNGNEIYFRDCFLYYDKDLWAIYNGIPKDLDKNDVRSIFKSMVDFIPCVIQEWNADYFDIIRGAFSKEICCSHLHIAMDGFVSGIVSWLEASPFGPLFIYYIKQAAALIKQIYFSEEVLDAG